LGYASPLMSRKAGKRKRGTWTRDEIQVADADVTHRSIQGTAIGNFMEAYDFTLFSLVATILAQKFYPDEKEDGASRRKLGAPTRKRQSADPHQLVNLSDNRWRPQQRRWVN
jgi:hypothetical protein